MIWKIVQFDSDYSVKDGASPIFFFQVSGFVLHHEERILLMILGAMISIGTKTSTAIYAMVKLNADLYEFDPNSA